METNTNAEIQGAKAASRNLSSKLYKLDQESLKQQEIVYNQVLFFQLFIIIIIFKILNPVFPQKSTICYSKSISSIYKLCIKLFFLMIQKNI